MFRLPLFAREDENLTQQFKVLVEGIPDWMRQPLIQWTYAFIETEIQSRRSESFEVDLALHLRLEIDMGRGRSAAIDQLISSAFQDERLAFSLVDGCLGLASEARFLRSDSKFALQKILDSSNSVWTIGTDESGYALLLRRVDPTLQTSFDEITSTGSRASKHLSIAWSEVHRSKGDASAGYREAVRAVESLLIPIVAPIDQKPTLGRMIKSLRDKPDKWSYVMGNTEVFIQMLDNFWSAQYDRHGSDEEDFPMHVSINEARAAVYLAVAIVQILMNDFLERLD